MELSLLTWNLWHGLSGKGYRKMEELESPIRRQLRWNNQFKIIKELSFDIACFQEVNPLAVFGRQLEAIPDTETVSVNDNCGTKVLGIGFPRNLDSGLLTAFKKERFSLEDVSSLRLSGDLKLFAKGVFSLQFKESRWALMTVLKERVSQRSWLVVNTHFHHKSGWRASVQAQLLTFLREKKLSQVQYENIREKMKLADKRRMDEWSRLWNAIQSYSVDNVFVFGDFNSEVSGELYNEVLNQGFEDISQLQSVHDGMSLTWSYENNKNISIYSCHFKGDFSDENLNEEVHQFLKLNELRSRKIDFVFFKGQADLRVSESFLLRQSESFSDHYAINIKGRVL